jgi:hypothetical protein
VFDKYDTERLAEWKQFRDRLEVSDTPLEDVANLWSLAPFVNPYLNPNNPSEWPDPWHLVLDSRLDDLAITLGMLYTIKLTQRFMASECEIHTSMSTEEKHPMYFLLLDKKYALNLEYKRVVEVNNLQELKSRVIWTKV